MNKIKHHITIDAILQNQLILSTVYSHGISKVNNIGEQFTCRGFTLFYGVVWTWSSAKFLPEKLIKYLTNYFAHNLWHWLVSTNSYHPHESGATPPALTTHMRVVSLHHFLPLIWESWAYTISYHPHESGDLLNCFTGNSKNCSYDDKIRNSSVTQNTLFFDWHINTLNFSNNSSTERNQGLLHSWPGCRQSVVD